MQPEVVLIQQPAINFDTFLSLSHKALGYSPAASADATSRKLTDAERFVSCLAAFSDRSARAGFAPNLLSHVSFSLLIVAEDRDLWEILEAGGGMPFSLADTVAPGVKIGVMTGTLGQWRDAVKSGLSLSAKSSTRNCYTKVLSAFERSGLASIWSDMNRRATTGGLLLEDKRK